MRSKITLSFARLLQSVSTGEVNAASFSSSNKRMLDQFLRDDVLDFRLIGNQQKKIFCADPANLAKYLHNKFESLRSMNTFFFLNAKKYSAVMLPGQ